MNLADQIKVAEAAATGQPYTAADMQDVVKSLTFLAKYETEIRASVPAWKIAREVTAEFPDAKTILREDGYHEITFGGEDGET